MKQLTFDLKMIRFISGALILSTTAIILVSAISTVNSLTRKSAQMAQREAEAMTANMEDNFKQYQSLIWSLILDKNIQTYLEMDGRQYESIDSAYSVLTNTCNMWENINFITIIRSDGGGHLSKGPAVPNWIVDYEKRLEENYDSSLKMSNGNEMRLAFTNEYNVKGRYSLSIFYPLYSSSRLSEHRLGTLCININDANLLQLLASAKNTDTLTDFTLASYFVHKSGRIICCGDLGQIDTVLEDSVTGQPVTFTWKHVMVQKALARWDFSYITYISWWDLLKDSARTVFILVAVLCLCILALIRMAKRLVLRAYEPWGNVVRAMAAVSAGELDTRLPPLESAPDMRVVSSGFNGMMEQIIKLMEQVKEEQFRIDQIRMVALQAQIQPHFLYNTLDCIHWQAVGSGNRDISKMVKALASYYRICLSKGSGIITIEEELEHVRNYLYIQKIRYEDILNYGITADPLLGRALIPKLTLQPLVENAIYHGIKRLEQRAGRIHIAVLGHGDEAGKLRWIQIDVADNGVGMDEGTIAKINGMIAADKEDFGYGVRNVNRRIRLFYGAEYGLSYGTNGDGGVTVTVRIPYMAELKGKQVVI